MTPEFVVYDHAIGGKLVVGKATISAEYNQLIDSGDPKAREELKSSLIHQMATYMLKHKLVEFTTYDDNTGMNNSKIVAIRAYLAPDSAVRILRTTHKI